MNDPQPDTKLEIPDRAELERRYEETWGSGNDTFSLDGETDWVLRDPDYEAMTIEHFWDDGF